ncbi:MAG: hypothetical protein NTZ37_05755 [Methanoregula sp.]|jgi:hypothetical protein|nr:hypothetical protein [Methanoregula sp.]
MTGRRNDPWDKPWVSIAVVIGIIAVVAIALVFFIGSGNISDQSLPGTTTPIPSGSGTQVTQVSGTGASQMTIKVPTTVSIPVTGVFVKISYIGGFAGTYGVNGVVQKVRNSGDRLYEITNATGNVSATFKKEDGSTSHDITVELWQNGKSLTSAKNSTPFGTASINYTL